MSTFTGYRDTWAEVSLPAIEQNARWLASLLPRDCLLMAVVKADGYGHGAAETARAALRAGARYLGVALVDEGLQLRDAGVEAPILVLGHTPLRSVEAAVRRGLALTVFAPETVDEAAASAARLGLRARLHLKADTGMTRLGVRTSEEALNICRRAFASDWVVPEGIFTHFSAADAEDPTETHRQFDRFLSIVGDLEREGFRFPIRHCCNSAATLRFPHMHLDMARAGIALYGLAPGDRRLFPALRLTSAMSLKTKVASVKRVPPDRGVSYGHTFRTARDSVVATIPVGYADGLSRALSNRGSALVRGLRVPIVGAICMDQTMLDATDAPDVRPEDDVLLFGVHDGVELPCDEMASLLGTIHYEIVSSVGKRVPRLYRED
jgi:alanine racemase